MSEVKRENPKFNIQTDVKVGQKIPILIGGPVWLSLYNGQQNTRKDIACLIGMKILPNGDILEKWVFDDESFAITRSERVERAQSGLHITISSLSFDSDHSLYVHQASF